MQFQNTRDTPGVMSFLAIRKAIGFLGMLLPFVLLAGGYLIGCHMAMPSISHYYYTELVTVFTGTMCAVGLFLITYKGFGPLDDFGSNLAGLCAFGVALFPTGSPEDGCSIYSTDFSTPPSWIHYTFASIFFITLALISIFLFTKTHPGKEKSKTPEKIIRNRIYTVTGILMLLFSILVPVTSKFVPAKYNTTFWCETCALFCFGISWAVKGEFILKD